MISPASRLTGRNLEQFGFRRRFNAIVLGIQRRTRMIRAAMSEIRLEAGDVLMVQGAPEDIRALRGHPDLILLEWSATDLPSPFHARRATATFLGTVLLAATGVLPIVIAAVLGAAGMIVTGCLTARQAARAIDRTVFMMMGAALALGVALEATGGASYLADALLRALGEASIGDVATLPSGVTVPAYRGIPIVPNDWNPVNQTTGSLTTGTTVMAGTLDDGSGLHGISGLTAANAAGIVVEEVGIAEAKDETITRVKWYSGLAMFSELGLAALTGVSN